MELRQSLLQRISSVDENTFSTLALDIFQYQAAYLPLYADYLNLLQIEPSQVEAVADIPFLPIQFFKKELLKTGSWNAQKIFTSSGTTGATTAQHPVRELDFYLDNTQRGFEQFYGDLSNYCILALLPAYLERQGSSLVAMADDFIKKSKYAQSGFFLHDLKRLSQLLITNQQHQIPTLLIGVSFALWDLAEQFPADYSKIIIMETGGMKGRRPEITRTDLHQIFNQAFQTQFIHSEYGMTELLSQAYSKGNGIFYPTATMRVTTREVTDPFQPQGYGKTGVLNIIDLANLDTISFIATDDLGKVFADGSFTVLGRLDASDVRGCNLLVLE
ncbi:MAG: acyl transferase [Saprospiraceae bacterium]